MKLAMVFPGQGSQTVGMLKAYAGLPAIDAVREEASGALGAEFLRLLDDGPAEQLNLTVNTQPAMVTAGIGAYRAWTALGGPPPEIVAGHKAAVARAIEACKARGAKRALPLPVSAPFHSALMRPAAERLAHYLGSVDLQAPRVALVNNVDVAIEREPARIKDALVRQAAAPVRWAEIVRRLAASGVTHVLECGPGKVLAGLTKRIDGNLQALALADQASVEQALATVRGG